MRITISPGDIFGRLTIVEEAPKRGKERTFVARCDCGVSKVVFLCNLRAGKSTTCGCGQRIIKHGQWRSPTYSSWASMVNRCSPTSSDLQSIKAYSDRGICIDPNWHLFTDFLADMGERPPGKTLERIDNNGNYTKANCRWATRAEQMRNTRRTKFVVIGGERVCLMDASRIIGVNYRTIRAHAERHAKTFQQAVDHYAARRHVCAGVTSTQQP